MRNIIIILTVIFIVSPRKVEAQSNKSEVMYYFGGSLGRTYPIGKISSITELISFESPIAATDIYDKGFVIGIHGGTREGHILAEVAIDMRLSPVTSEGKKILNSVSIMGKKVSLEYATLELFVGGNATIWSSQSSRIDAFLGLGIGAGDLQLYQESAEEPFNDAGFTGSVKIGMDYTRQCIMYRIAGKYQALNLGVDFPRDYIIYLGAYFSPLFFNNDN